MKTFGICLLLAALASLSSAANQVDAVPEVAVGDSAESVRAVLGEPRGYLGCAGHEILVYPRGRVEIRDGAVIEVDLMTAEEAERQRLERERLRAQREAERVREKERLRIEGLRIKNETLSDPRFPGLAASVQLAFWKKFSRMYPDVPVELEIAKAQALVLEEKERKQNELRLLAMERRVEEAERQARRAQRDAREARRRRDRYDVWYVPPYVSYYPRGQCARNTGRNGKLRPAGRHSSTAGTHQSVKHVYGFRKKYPTMPARVDRTTLEIERLRSDPHSPPPSPDSFFSAPYSFGVGGPVDRSRDRALYHTVAGGVWTVDRNR
jgi:hypothetical protein